MTQRAERLMTYRGREIITRKGREGVRERGSVKPKKVWKRADGCFRDGEVVMTPNVSAVKTVDFRKHHLLSGGETRSYRFNF